MLNVEGQWKSDWRTRELPSRTRQLPGEEGKTEFPDHTWDGAVKHTHWAAAAIRLPEEFVGYRA